MTNLLKPKQNVHTVSLGMACEVEQFLGGGGQGEVYRANLDGKQIALKWYNPTSAVKAQRDALEILVKKGSPNDKFLWPMELTEEPGLGGFGYIMPLREGRYKGLVDLMKGRVEPTFRSLATAGLELAHSFLLLHARGLCYRDISFGNVFFDPASGEILICDNDNVTVDDGTSWGGVLGTARFMAPEIVRGEAMPSTRTDLFSLSVLLFYMFMIHHPLEGRKELSIHCFDMAAMMKLYGTEPVFIFDAVDHSNEPVPNFHDNALIYWNIYPQFLRNLFTKAFTDGLRDAEHGRVREGVWRSAMVRLRDSILYCGHCGSENFYDVDALSASGGKPAPCWSCKKDIRLPFRIRIDRNVIMLNHDTQLFPHHIEGKMYDFSQPVAQVTQHPTNPSIWGLKNLTEKKWAVTKPDNTMQEIEPGRSVALVNGTKIHFGQTQGEIRY